MRAIFCEQLFEKSMPIFGLNPCNNLASLVETFSEAAQRACFGGLNFKSLTCSSFDLFRNCKNRGEKLCVATESISWGAPFGNPNGMGKRPGTIL
jgi:UDP-N-acetylmuramoylalanine-D-glutamate ligase